MSRIFKALISTLVIAALAGCGVSMSTKRANYEGTDQVGAIDMNMLVGTWQIKVINPRESDGPLDAKYTINADGSFSGYSGIDLTERGADVVVYDVTGNWSVNGDTINQTVNTVKQSAGTPFAAFGVAPGLGLSAGQTTVTNVYEASADHLIIVNEQQGVARYFTRVK